MVERAGLCSNPKSKMDISLITITVYISLSVKHLLSCPKVNAMNWSEI
jgi:hypothetical protein